MTPEAQHQAIAEECGYYLICDDETGAFALRNSDVNFRGAWHKSTDAQQFAWEDAPDYLSDLNAMHEAEKVLTPEHYDRWISDLWNLVAPDQPFERAAPLRLLAAFARATAAQRAEAFLKALGTFMSNDNLDTMADGELDEAFVVEVMEWTIERGSVEYDGAQMPWRVFKEPDGTTHNPIPFCTDANAVLPWLPKHWRAEAGIQYDTDSSRKITGSRDVVIVKVKDGRATAPTFARAAVIALLRAKRGSKP